MQNVSLYWSNFEDSSKAMRNVGEVCMIGQYASHREVKDPLSTSLDSEGRTSAEVVASVLSSPGWEMPGINVMEIAAGSGCRWSGGP